VVFESPGSKTVRLTVCNGDACETIEREVVVLDPRPSVLSAVVGTNLATIVTGLPIVAHRGDLLRLIGTGDGRPTLEFSWQVLAGLNAITELAGADAWWSTSGLPTGVYGVRLRIRNQSGEAFSLPAVVTILPPEALSFFTVTPCRVYDSRSTSPLAAGADGRLLQVAGTCGIPPDARAVVGNLTVVAPTAAGSLLARAGNYPDLNAATVSFAAGRTRSSLATVQLATDGTGTAGFAATMPSGGSTHFIFDVSGYYAVP
jgi:hypothetical protein